MTKNKEREEKNARSMLAPDSCKVGAIEIRPISLESLSILSMLGNPLVGESTIGEEPGMAAMAEFIWVHGADPDEVLAVALECSPVHKPGAREAAMRFVRGVTQADMMEVMRYVKAQWEQIRAADFESREHEPKKKA